MRLEVESELAGGGGAAGWGAKGVLDRKEMGRRARREKEQGRRARRGEAGRRARRGKSLAARSPGEEQGEELGRRDRRGKSRGGDVLCCF
jgi:hypothetical protein